MTLSTLNTLSDNEHLDHGLMRIDKRQIPKDPGEVRLFMVGIDAGQLIPPLMEHYHSIGVDRIFYIDNNSSDNSIEVLSEFPNTHIWTQKEVFVGGGQKESDIRSGAKWIEVLLKAYGVNQWCLTVDTDELFIYPDYETKKIQAFVQEQDELSFNCVEARMIDMYSDKRVRDTELKDTLIESCPYYDRSEYGCRERVLGFRPNYIKYPLIKYTLDMVLGAGYHKFIAGEKRMSNVKTGLLHFKFLVGLEGFINNHGDKMTGSEVKKSLYNSAIDINFYDPEFSFKYHGSKDLLHFKDYVFSRAAQLDSRKKRPADSNLVIEDLECEYESIKDIDANKDTCTIIIGCFNQFTHTRALIDSLQVNIDASNNYIFYFFDDHSPELDTLEFFEREIDQIPLNLRFFRYTRNKKLTWTWNNGINLAKEYDRPDYFIFLNNDVRLSKSWTKQLIDFSNTKENLCAVGPISDNCRTHTGQQKIEHYLGSIIDLSEKREDEILALLQDQQPVNLDDTDFLNGFCFLIPSDVLERSIFKKKRFFTYYFNPAYPHYSNEKEFFKRFEFEQYILPYIVIFHEGGASNKDYVSDFGYLYKGKRINKKLIKFLLKYFRAKEKKNENFQKKLIMKIDALTKDGDNTLLMKDIKENSIDLNADVRILNRQKGK